MAYARLQFAHFFSLEAHLIRFTFRMGPVWFVGPCSYLFLWMGASLHLINITLASVHPDGRQSLPL